MRSLLVGLFGASMGWVMLACVVQLQELSSPEALRVAFVGAALAAVSGTLAIAAPRAKGSWLWSILGTAVGLAAAGAAGTWAGGDALLRDVAAGTASAATATGAAGPTRPAVRRTRRPAGPELALDRQTRRVVARFAKSYRAQVPAGTMHMMFGVGQNPNASGPGRIVVLSLEERPRVLWEGRSDPKAPSRWRDVRLDVTGVERVEIVVQSLGRGPAGAVVSEPAWVRSPAGLTPRNLILISIDTLRADMLGAYGFTELPTSPNLDALAARGTIFEHAYAPTPWTTPSHMGLLTGVQPDALGAAKLRQAPRIARERSTLAELFRRAGYLTVAFTGTGTLSASHGFSDGFYLQQESYARQAVWPRDLDTNVYLATEWIRRNGEQPLFLFFHTFEVHDPYVHQRFMTSDVSPKDSFRVSYASGIALTDDRLGRFLSDLEAMGYLDESIVVVTSDHGEGFGAWPRNYHGKTLFDEVLHVPLIMAGSTIPEGRRVTPQVPTLDLFATIADLYHLPLPDDVDSHSLAALLAGESDEPRPVHLCCISPHRDKATAPYKPQLLGVRRDGFKYVIDENGENEQLYDLAADPGEQHNLVDAYGAVARRFRQEVVERATRNLDRAGTGIGSASRRMDPEYEKKLRDLGYLR